MRLRKTLSFVLLLRIAPFLSLSYAGEGEKRFASSETTETRDELPKKRCKRGTTSLGEYRRAQQEFGTICDNNPDMLDTAFDDVSITDARSFFLTLIVCAHAVSTNNETLRDKMLAKLNEQENLVKFPMLFEAFRNVFCDPRDEGHLSNVAVITHRCEVVIALMVIYSALKSRPKFPNYEKVRRMYMNYNRQVKNQIKSSL